jgi:carboxypeptidase family protein/TonB-dependent receptor-like protein
MLKAFFLSVLALFPAGAPLQTETGKITGTVTDPTGAVIAGASVTIKRLDTAAERQIATDEAGNFIAANLPPAVYGISVYAPGFSTEYIRVQVTVGSSLSIDISLGISETRTALIIYSDPGSRVETESQELSTVVNQKQIRELPTLTRNPYDLVILAGNISSLTSFADESEGDLTGRGVNFAINGQRASGVNVLLDGADNNDNFNALVGQNVPLDSVQEFRIITSNFSAEYGRASAGIVNVVTKSGGNHLHGTAYEFNRISALASNDFDNNAQEIRKGVFTRNQFGYSAGGPIKRNKLFFFNSGEFIRVCSSQPTIFLVPTPQLIARSSVATRTFFNAFPLEAPINGDVITRGDLRRLNPDGPFAQLPGNLPVFGEVIIDVASDAGGGNPQNTYEFVSRLDWNIGDATTFYFRYALENRDFFPGTGSASPYRGFNTGSDDFNNNILFSLTHSFSPRLITQSKFVFNRLRNNKPLGKNPPGPALEASFSIAGFPLTFPGYTEDLFGGPQNLAQAYQDVNYTFGKHGLRFGGSYLHLQDDRRSGAAQNAKEILSLNTLANALDNLVRGQLQAFSVAISPQGKYPADTIKLPVSPPNFSRNNRFNEFALYLNHAWRTGPRITVNLGLRYEYFGVQHNKNERLDSNFYPGSGSTIFEQIRNGKVMVAPDSPAGRLYKPDKNNFAPRIGFAWDIFGDSKTALRGGYGIGYERNAGSVTFDALFNPPNYAIVTLQAGVDLTAIPITLSNAGPLSGSGSIRLPPTELTYINQNLRTAYAHFWSFSLERELFNKTVVAINYSGSRGVDLYSIESVNRAGSGAVYLGDRARLSRLNNQYSDIFARSNNGFSSYHGLTVGIESGNLANTGLMLTANYTWSHSIDNLSSTLSISPNNKNLGLLDPFNPRLDKGHSDFDARHRFVTSGVWDIPFAREKKGLTGNLLGGWSLNYIFTAETGKPFTIFDCSNSLSVCPRLILTGPINQKGPHNPPSSPDEPNLFQYIDLSNQAEGAGSFINPKTKTSDLGPYPSSMTARNAFRGPGQWRLDSSLTKVIRINDRYSLQLRAEIFNVFNHANLFIVGSEADIGSTEFVPAKRLGRRQVQLAIKFIF